MYYSNQILSQWLSKFLLFDIFADLLIFLNLTFYFLVMVGAPLVTQMPRKGNQIIVEVVQQQ
jgi:hypothetical protein